MNQILVNRINVIVLLCNRQIIVLLSNRQRIRNCEETEIFGEVEIRSISSVAIY